MVTCSALWPLRGQCSRQEGRERSISDGPLPSRRFSFSKSF
uniref:Uncharacterized protein n=1 Tax=Setaria italica TaxID=4555 RepID=K3ZGE7_SETIT